MIDVYRAYLDNKPRHWTGFERSTARHGWGCANGEHIETRSNGDGPFLGWRGQDPQPIELYIAKNTGP